MSGRRNVKAVVAAALLLAGLGGTARAETHVVLDNESHGTEVKTGEATFNNTNNSSSVAKFDDPPGAGAQAVQQVAGTSAPLAATAEDAVSESNVQTPVTAPAASTNSDDLFVGFLADSTSIAP